MLKSFFVSFLTLTTCISTLNADVKVNKSIDKKLGTVLQISNKYIDFALLPDKGGAIKSFKYLGTEFTSADGLLNDHLWSQKLHGDFWEKQYSYQIKKKKNAVSITLSKTGETGINKFLEIHKTITVNNDSPAVNVKYVWLNRANSMSKIQVKGWFHYIVSGPGKNRYFAPETSGVRQFDWTPGDAITERWLYDCADGWTGVVNPSTGKGIVFTPEYKYLQCFYNWKYRKLATLEWRNTPVTIDCGKTFETSFDIIPFNGLDVINGAGNGIVGELSNDAVKLFSAKAEKVNISIIKPSGKILKKTKVELLPNKVTTVKFPKNIFSITCKVEKNNKLLVELKRGSQKTPLQFTWKPREKRYRENQASLPWRYKLPDKLGLPYIPFAKPWIGGRMKVFFLVCLRNLANVTSMRERMDIEPYYTTLPYKWWTLGWIKPEQMPTGWIQLGNVVKKEALKKLPDDLKKANPQVIVVGESHAIKYHRVDFGWNLLPQDICQRILKMVESGTGLVVIGTHARQKNWKYGLQAIFDKSKPAPSITLDQALPLSLRDCARSAKFGKGTVIFLNYPGNGLLPHMKYEEIQDRLEETMFSMAARAVIEAGGKTQSGQPAKTETFYLRQGIEYRKKPAIAGNYVAVKVNRDKNDKVTDWSFDKLNITAPNRITGVNPSTQICKQGEPVTVHVTLERPEDILRLECFDNYGRLVKSLSQKSKMTNRKFTFKIDNPLTVIYKLVATLHRNKKIISRETSQIFLPYVYENQPAFMFHLWGGTLPKLPEYYIGAFQDQARNIGFESIGEGTVWKIDETSKYNAAANFRVALVNLSRAVVKPEQAANMISQYKKTGDTKYLTRNPCMNNPRQRKEIENKIIKAASETRKYGSMIYMLGDEMSLTTEGGSTPLDICFSPFCIHKFRAELKKQFRTINKLNTAWNSSFKNFDQIKPLTLDQANKTNNWASWLAHRQFMDSVYADYFKWTRDAVHKVNPKGMIGESGIHDKMSAYGGYAWPKRMKFERVAAFYGTGVLPMSFANRHNFAFSSWCMGYADEIAKDEFDMWQALFRGQNMISLFCSSILVNPDTTLSYYGKALKPIIREVLAGPGDALAVSDKTTSPVAILISQKSLLSTYIQKQQSVIDTYQLYRSGIEMWLNILMQYGYSPYYINAPQLTEGILEKRKCKALILPMACVLTKAEAASVRNFVQKGGIVIADACTATWSQFGKPLKSGRLDDVFGIERNNSQLTAASATYNFSGKKISAAILESGIKPSGTPLTSSEEDNFFGSICFGKKSADNTMTVNNFGKGKAYYLGALGLKLGYKGGAMPLSLLKQNRIMPLVNISCSTGASESENGTFKSGEITYYGIIDTNKQEKSGKTLNLYSKSYVYELRSGQAHGLTDKILLKPNGIQLFATLPRPPQISLDMPPDVNRGNSIPLRAKVNIKGKYPLHLTVKNPDGQEITPLTRNIMAPATHQIPLALNDKRGTWKVIITDVITGKKITKEIEVK